MNELLRVSIRIAAEAVEEANARLLDLAPGGLEVGGDSATAELSGYVDAAGAERIRAAFPGAEVEPVPSGWEDAWRAFHRPVRAGGVWIGPPWEERPTAEPTVVIDPGRAFGTGAHATTRLCVELLAVAERGSLIDVGCGSGVLAIAADRLGYGPLVAVDDDPVAIEVTRANATVNGVAVDAFLVDATAGMLPPAEVAVANILLGAVESVLARLDTRFAITSGYLVGERPSASGWTWLEGRDTEGWAADLFARSSAPRQVLAPVACSRGAIV